MITIVSGLPRSGTSLMMQMLAAGGVPVLTDGERRAARHNYQILFMERPLIEVVASQDEMIRRRGTSGTALSEAALIAGLQAHLNQVKAWLQRRHDILLCRVEYHQVLRNPRCASETVQRFLQWRLDLEAMVQQVDQSLYRCRIPGTA